ncbi:hypothetical protein HanXRQr2_Chr09g0400401 [Helianthus annuus]|uniref:Uncharacterized protein n=1 Tax=Helianthus annuus TaxID=4232 RepID=A0A9K3I8K7_HELAN|nr:hypothetical protein HanXRQr2_Chr09g0400401 [Helianthus annuus]KAJ0535506.1 hypothetical protein HanIR_Chr09g0431371 [Helianthus annuus]KAJ0712318.1 hypothetical protein HanOQP8_Chr09g0333541 [Helianthus annuus]KAJ0894180.1 hypothetical protein HanPSC8_Chr09g0386161 [Helianthus annuus]
MRYDQWLRFYQKRRGFSLPPRVTFSQSPPNLHLQQNPTNLQNHATRSNLTTVSILSCNQQPPPISPPYSATTENHTTPTPSRTFNPLPDEPPPDDHWSFCSHHPTNPLKVIFSSCFFKNSELLCSV